MRYCSPNSSSADCSKAIITEPLNKDNSDALMQGGTIKGSMNLPAQSLYPSLPTLVNLARAGKIQTVIWYCGKTRQTFHGSC